MNKLSTMCKCAATVLAAMSCANVASAADTTLSSSSNISINIGISNDGNERWNVESGGLMLGWNNAPGLGQVQMGKSLDLSWFEIVRARYVITSGTSISLGAGLDWRNYRITTPNSRFVENAGTVSLAGYENEVFPNNSRLKTLAINVPLMVRQDLPLHMFGERQYVAVGASANFVVRSSILTCLHNAEGEKIKLTSRDVDYRKVNFDLVGILGITSEFGLYVKYTPMSILTGPTSFKSFVTGIVICY
jgi:hypothetical protein